MDLQSFLYILLVNVSLIPWCFFYPLVFLLSLGVSFIPGPSAQAQALF